MRLRVDSLCLLRRIEVSCGIREEPRVIGATDPVCTVWLKCLSLEIPAPATDLLALVAGPLVANDEDGHDDDKNGDNDEY